MRKTFKTVLSCALFGSVAVGQAQSWSSAFEEGFPSSSGVNSCTPLDATTGSSNMFFTAGYFSGSVTFGSTTLTSTSGSDAFLTRINGTTGVAAWAIKASGGTSDAFKKVELVGADVFVYGTVSTTSVTLYSTSGSPVTLTGITGGFLAKYNYLGVLQWAVPYAGTVTDMAYVAATQRLYTIGLNDVVTNRARVKSIDGTTGSVLYDMTSNHSGYSTVNKSIGADASNCYILVDISAGTFSVPTQPSTVTLSATGQDLVMMKLDATLAYVDARVIGNPGSTTETPKDIDCSGGNLYITGNYENGTTYMDGTSSASFTLTNVGGPDIFVAKYNTSLVTQWAKKIAASGADIPLSMSLDPNAHPFILVQNKQNNSITIDPCPLIPAYTSTGGFDNKWYMVKYLPDGTVEWTAAPLVMSANAMPIAVQGANSSARIVGYSEDETDFGSTALYGSGKIYMARAAKMACRAGEATGIEESASAGELAVYPNPTAGLIHIPVSSDDKNVQVTLTDNLGKEVLKAANLESRNGELNVESLPAGIYFYTVTKGEASYKGKIVKQ